MDHRILLRKLEYYGIRGLSNNWFRSYLTNRQQYVSINGYNSNNKPMLYGVPQGSVLGPLLFLIYINDLNIAIKFSKTHHFADDTNLLFADKSLKKIQKFVNLDLKLLCCWLKANKISLNASKTELIVFRDPRRKSNHELKIKIDGKKLVPSKFVKYLGILIDCHLTWNVHTVELKTKLSRAVGMLSKIRHYVKIETLINIYYGIFSSLMRYGSQIWGQLNSAVKKIQVIQNKAIRIMNFSSIRTSATPLFRKCNILKLCDIVTHDSLRGNLPSSLTGRFSLVNTVNNTRNEMYHQLNRDRSKTITYGSFSIKTRSIDIWNSINKLFHNENLQQKKKLYCKKKVTKFLLERY